MNMINKQMVIIKIYKIIIYIKKTTITIIITNDVTHVIKKDTQQMNANKQKVKIISDDLLYLIFYYL